jgi:hypothetical protein
MFGTFLQGDGWNQPDLGKLFPTAGKDIDSHIDAIGRTLLLTELGSADRKSIKNAVTRVFGSNLNLDSNTREKTSLIVRLVLQLPVWSLR